MTKKQFLHKMETEHVSLLILMPIYLLTYLAHFVQCRDVLPQAEHYHPDYNIYHNLSRIRSHLEEIVSRNPNYMKIDWSYTSRQNRPQLMVRVTNFTESYTHRVHVTAESEPFSKVKVLLSYGEHAREFIPIESMFYLLNNLTAGLSRPDYDPAYHYSRTILSKVDLFLVAMMNPDGRQYVENTGNYCWRGTSTGVDLNRNFDWNFGAAGSSPDITDEEYRGSEPYSEPESYVLVDLTSRYKFDAFVSLHSGIRQIYVPFADTESKRLGRKPDNIEHMTEFADAIAKASRLPFRYGLAYQLNEYTADGTIFDYMAGKRKIPFSFAIELWGEGDDKKSKCFDLFNPANHELQFAVQEIHPLYVIFFHKLIEWKQTQTLMYGDPSKDPPSLTLGFILLGTLILFFVFIALHNRLPPCMRLYPRRRIVSLRALSSTFSMASVMRP